MISIVCRALLWATTSIMNGSNSFACKVLCGFQAGSLETFCIPLRNRRGVFLGSGSTLDNMRETC